jgi:DNA primase
MKRTYDRFELDKLDSLPVLEVGKRLGLKITRNQAMCFNGHDRMTPSLSFKVEKNYWHCFGCGEGGKNISLVRKALKISFRDAVRWLQNEFSLDVKEVTYQSATRRIVIDSNDLNIKRDKEEEPDVELYNWFINELDISKVGRSYLIERGFRESTIEHFKIRDIADSTDMFVLALKKWGLDRLRNAGLVAQSSKNNVGFRLLWWDHTIVFPFFQGDAVVYLQGRRLKADKYGKYINLIGRKKRVFNLGELSKLRPADNVYMCEGVMDAIAAYQEGFTAIALLGQNTLSESLVELLMPFELHFVRDADETGKALAEKVAKVFSECGKVISILVPNEGKDLAEYHRLKMNNNLKEN